MSSVEASRTKATWLGGPSAACPGFFDGLLGATQDAELKLRWVGLKA